MDFATEFTDPWQQRFFKHKEAVSWLHLASHNKIQFANESSDLLLMFH
jgi:hypothetical protein